MDNKIESQRNNVDKFITYCEAVIGMPEPNVTKGYLDAKNKIITEFWNKLDRNHDEIVQEVEEGDMRSNYFTQRYYDKAFNLYDKVMIKIQTKLEKFEKVTGTPNITLPKELTLNTNQDDKKLRLKPIDIPKFTGDYK